MRHTTSLDLATDRAGAIRILLASSSVAAGAIHAIVVPEHLRESWVLGMFFILAAAVQIAWAVPVAFRLSPGVYLTGALANGAMIGLWLVSRAIGVPLGPDPWMPEPAAALDVTATLLELLLVLGALVLFRRRGHAGSDGTLGRDLPWSNEGP